jgi:hypothetical protein
MPRAAVFQPDVAPMRASRKECRGAADSEVFELMHELEGSLRQLNRLSQLVNPGDRRVAEKLRPSLNVCDLVWVETHEPRTSGVCGHGIIGEDDPIQ